MITTEYPAPCKLLLTLCILMDFPMHIDTICVKLSNLYSNGSLVDFLNNGVVLSLWIMLHSTSFKSA